MPDPDATPANASQDDDPLLQEVTASDARQTVGLAALGMAGTGDSAPVTQDVFSGKFERLRDVCCDPAPLARDLDLARFTGREWLIRQIDAFIQHRPRGYVIIQAEAGVGKSTLAAHLAGTRPWPCHFTRLPGGRSPEAARKSLAAQLIAGWDLPKWAPDGMLPVASSRPDWFSRLLEAAARERDQQRPEERHREPIVMVVDGLDEAEPEPAGGRGLPLGLPDSLPDGVYVVATSRFGIDRALHAVRNPADWLQIDVEGTGNLDDMRRFIQDVTSPEGGDQRLMEMLDGAGVDIGWFRANVAQACAGVWIYLRYVLDEIRDGIRNPRSVGDLPGDLAGFYAEQIERWRGAAEDETAHWRWEQVRLPLLGVLGAARTPLTEAELAEFTRMPSTEAARVFVEETARAFLSCRDDDPPGSPKHASRHGSPKYALRHQSLRDLLTGNIPVRPDLQNAARMLTAQVQAAHRQITSVLTPDGEPGERAWDTVRPYARQHLPAHAAACGELDFLASDPGFLLAADPGAVLAQRANLRTADGKRALAAFDLSLHDWEAATSATRLDRLAANAARVHATALAAACVIAGGEWPVRWAAWTGQGHRRLARHGSVRAVAIGRARQPGGRPHRLEPGSRRGSAGADSSQAGCRDRERTGAPVPGARPGRRDLGHGVHCGFGEPRRGRVGRAGRGRGIRGHDRGSRVFGPRSVRRRGRDDRRRVSHPRGGGDRTGQPRRRSVSDRSGSGDRRGRVRVRLGRRTAPRIPQVGIVVLEDDVDVGANACVDRAALTETRIGRGTKIDNLAQIGHNVTIGEHSIVCGQVGIAGSARIGKGVTLAGQVGVADRMVIGDGATVTAQAGVMRTGRARSRSFRGCRPSRTPTFSGAKRRRIACRS